MKAKTPKEMHQIVHSKQILFAKGNKMFDKLVRNGWNLTGQPSWDQVEFHLRIFGHLPEKTCKMFLCEKDEDCGREKVGDFIEWLCSFAE